jgi:hypothetical protein
MTHLWSLEHVADWKVKGSSKLARNSKEYHTSNGDGLLICKEEIPDKIRKYSYRTSDLRNELLTWLLHHRRPTEGALLDVRRCRTSRDNQHCLGSIMISYYSQEKVEVCRVSKSR